mmetsp:Transcript_31470/g.108244  ORF Transcript_31470/g.108244 Transcript_31470/m.108244 type:complete len:208 (+) Transcript_31470:346-969(+)
MPRKSDRQHFSTQASSARRPGTLARRTQRTAKGSRSSAETASAESARASKAKITHRSLSCGGFETEMRRSASRARDSLPAPRSLSAAPSSATPSPSCRCRAAHASTRSASWASHSSRSAVITRSWASQKTTRSTASNVHPTTSALEASSGWNITISWQVKRAHLSASVAASRRGRHSASSRKRDRSSAWTRATTLSPSKVDCTNIAT